MIVLDYSDKRPIYEQVVGKFKDLIYKGALKADDQMPSVRSLAVELSINPNTIQRAYAELERDGFIHPVKGRGNYVSNIGGMLPKRKQAFYEEMDGLLSRLPELEIGHDELIEHIENYVNQNKLFDKEEIKRGEEKKDD